MDNNVIEINGLSKSFKEVKAVDNISFKVKEGELFAFLGINGAGKSTTISMICGTLEKDGGSIVIDGADADKARAEGKIGVVFQSSVLDKMLSVKDNLKSRAACYGICGRDFENRLAEISSLFDLDDIMKRTVSKLSGGQRRRADIARALLSQPNTHTRRADHGIGPADEKEYPGGYRYSAQTERDDRVFDNSLYGGGCGRR